MALADRATGAHVCLALSEWRRLWQRHERRWQRRDRWVPLAEALQTAVRAACARRCERGMRVAAAVASWSAWTHWVRPRMAAVMLARWVQEAETLLAERCPSRSQATAAYAQVVLLGQLLHEQLLPEATALSVWRALLTHFTAAIQRASPGACSPRPVSWRVTWSVHALVDFTRLLGNRLAEAATSDSPPVWLHGAVGLSEQLRLALRECAFHGLREAVVADDVAAAAPDVGVRLTLQQRVATLVRALRTADMRELHRGIPRTVDAANMVGR